MITINFTHAQRMLFLFLVTLVSYGFFNAYLPITDSVESNYALTAVTMLHHDSWLSPMIYDQVWYDKPPLTYWALMITYKIFGINDFASRLPASLIASASVSLMYYLVAKIKGSIKVALASAILLMTCLQFWYISHAVATDGFLFFFSLATFAYAYLGITKADSSAMIKAYLAAGLAVLTKGPIGLLLPGLIILLFLISQGLMKKATDSPRLTQQVKTCFNPLGILLFLIIASPWYLAMYIAHGQDFINGFLGLQNMGRAMVAEHPKFNVWYYYLVLTPLALLPWTPLVISRLKNFQWRDSFDFFSALWALVIILFYSLVATKYPTYTMPALIPCIIWAGQFLVSLWEQGKKKMVGLLVYLPFCLYTLLLTIGIVSSNQDRVFPYLLILLVGHLIFYLVWHYTSYKKISLMIPCIALYSAVTIAVAPILMTQSGLQYKSYTEGHEGPIYIYGGYYTSMVYYTGKTPIQVYLNQEDDARWAQGKNIMPTIQASDFPSYINQSPNALIIVPSRNQQTFITSPLSTQSKILGQTQGGTVYLFTRQTAPTH